MEVVFLTPEGHPYVMVCRYGIGHSSVRPVFTGESEAFVYHMTHMGCGVGTVERGISRYDFPFNIQP